MSREKKLHVEGRVFAHPDAMELFQRTRALLAKAVMRRRALQFEPATTALRGAAASVQIIDLHKIDFMAAPLRLEHQNERRVLIDMDLIDGVHHDADFETTHNHTLPNKV